LKWRFQNITPKSVQSSKHSLILALSVAAIIGDEIGPILFDKKRDRRWRLPDRAIEPGENPAQAIVRQVRGETGLKIKPERIVGVFGGRGFPYRYPSGGQVEYTIVSSECSRGGSEEQFDTEETEHLGISLVRRRLLCDSLTQPLFFRLSMLRRTSSGSTSKGLDHS